MDEDTKKPEEQQVQGQAEVKPQAEKTPQPAPAEKTPQPAPEAPAAETAKRKNKKINRLSLKELEQKLQEVQAKMGSLTSSYAQQLLKRKTQLLEGQKTEDRKQKTDKSDF